MRLPPFEWVVEAHGPTLLRFCVGRAGADRGEDLFQETMISALRAYPNLRDPEAIRPWLYSIAARKAIDAHRTAARTPTPVEDMEALIPSVSDAPDLDGGIWSRVRALPEKQREAVGLRFLGDLTHREIATTMGISEAAARRNVFEGLKRLRQDGHEDLTLPARQSS
jgi:RNA polymerase sigma factor (sigma-70 family)